MDYASFLQAAGFSRSAVHGYQIREDDDCTYIYAWDISQYSLWYTIFLVDCVFIRLGYFVNCVPKEAERLENVIRESPQIAQYYLPQIAALRASRVPRYASVKTVDTCSFSNANEVPHTSLQDYFNRLMGVQLPAPPQ